MELGWIRAAQATAPPLSPMAMAALAAKADQVGIDQLWLPGLSLDALDQAPDVERTRLGFDLRAAGPVPSRRVSRLIKAGQARYGARFLVGLTLGATAADQTAFEQVETLLSDDPCQILPRDMRVSPPLPDVVLQTAPLSRPNLRRGSDAGFQVVSPAWQTPRDLARHWAEIVVGATHAMRRANPARWHLARLVYVSDDRAEIDAYASGPARAYLGAAGVVDGQPSDLLVAGRAQEVAQRLTELRHRIGPFGQLQVLDPGLAPETAMRQMDRIAAQVLPRIQAGLAPIQKRDLESV